MFSDPDSLTANFHVAVDARHWFDDRRGVRRYLHGILSRWTGQADCELAFVTRSLWAWRRRGEFARIAGDTRFTLQRGIPERTGLLWHPCNGRFLPPSPVRSAVTIHEFIASTAAQDEHNRPFLLALDEARLMLVPSQYLAQQLQAAYGIAGERIAVVPLAAETIFSSAKPAHRSSEPQEIYLTRALGGRPFIFHVGDVHDGEGNFATLYDSWRRAFPAGETALVTTSAPPVPYDGVINIQKPDDATLAECYRRALAVAICAPSTTTGLTMLEAMQSGTPVIACRQTAFPEIGQAAPYWIARPDDVMEWSLALRRMADEEALRAILRDLGLQRAREFSWERTAGATLTALREAAAP